MASGSTEATAPPYPIAVAYLARACASVCADCGTGACGGLAAAPLRPNPDRTSALAVRDATSFVSPGLQELGVQGTRPCLSRTRSRRQSTADLALDQLTVQDARKRRSRSSVQSWCPAGGLDQQPAVGRASPVRPRGRRYVPMWNIFPADSTHPDPVQRQLRTRGARSPALGPTVRRPHRPAAPARRGWSRSASPAAQPTGASVQPIVFQVCLFADQLDDRRSTSTSCPRRPSRSVRSIQPRWSAWSPHRPPPAALSAAPHHFTWLPTASTAVDAAATHSTPVTRRRP